MSRNEQPHRDAALPSQPVDLSGDPGLPERIRRLVHEQSFGVLCTQGGEEPHASLVACAFSTDLRAAVFATPVATRKYRQLTLCDRVALLLDNRPAHPGDLARIEALTVVGRAIEIERGELFDGHAELLIGRHPELRAFVQGESAALFRIDVSRYAHVRRFQEVGLWAPDRGSARLP